MRISQALKAREKMDDIAEIGKTGILSFMSLEADRCFTLYLGSLEISYNENPDRQLAFVINDINLMEGNVTATVVRDSYNGANQVDQRPWALPDGTQITIIGAWDHADESITSGELHRARGLFYKRHLADGTVFTGPINEIWAHHDRATVGIFNQDLSQVPIRPSISRPRHHDS